jgi:hypothetical protein
LGNDDFFEKSVIWKSVEASTVDATSQDLDQTRICSRNSFYSSKGSKTESSNDFGIYQFIRPKNEIGTRNCILKIENFSVKVFQASWQSNNIYAPKKISLSFGFDKNCSMFTTEEFSIEKIEEIQSFDLDPMVFVWSEEYEEKKSSPRRLSSQEIRATISDQEILEIAEQSMDEGGIDYIIFRNLIEELVESKKNQAEKEDNYSGAKLFVKVNFIGKTQRQPGDNLFYVCIDMLDLKGTCENW